MTTQDAPRLEGPDFHRTGIREGDLADGQMLLGHLHGVPVVLVRRGAEVFALGATCTHYGGPLAKGVFDGERVRCPWHHACFDVRTGQAVGPPALTAVDCYQVTSRDGRLFVSGKVDLVADARPIENPPESVVIVGGGAAGATAAGTLREEGYQGRITLVSADQSPPYDRPNLSKDYLAGNAPDDWLPLHEPGFYRDGGIDLILGRQVTTLDAIGREIWLDDGRRIGGDAVLLATGADPVRLDIPGATRSHVHYLRTLADCNAIIAAVAGVQKAVVVGASFIGLEVAAALIARGLDVHVVAPETVPMARVLGPELGAFVRALHEEHGVRFHLEQTVTQIHEGSVTLQGGTRIEADLVILGVGVRPSLALADHAGLAIERGVLVDEYLETSAPGIWAAGDIARWPDAYSGQRIRVEHWAVAERQGQTAARNILGRRERFDAVPFFWSQHYDVPINYVGHAEQWDQIDSTGSISDRDCLVAFRKDGRTLAMGSIYRDRESLLAELAMERRDEAALQGLVAPRSAVGAHIATPDPRPSRDVAGDPVTYASWESFPASDSPGWQKAID